MHHRIDLPARSSWFSRSVTEDRKEGRIAHLYATDRDDSRSELLEPHAIVQASTSCARENAGQRSRSNLSAVAEARRSLGGRVERRGKLTRRRLQIDLI